MIWEDVVSVLTVSIILLLSGCSSSSNSEIPKQIKKLENLTVISPEEKPSHSIDFEREVEFGQTGDVILGGIAGVAVDSLGRVFIADDDQNVIHAYKPNGRYIQQLGSEGKGPGEFTMIYSLQQQGSHLFAYDYRQHRVNKFDLNSLSFSRAISLSQGNKDDEELSGTYPTGFYIRNDGKLLVQFNETFGGPNKKDTERSTLYYLMDQEGNVVSDKIYETKTDNQIRSTSGDMMMIINPPYGRRSLLSTGPADNLYTSWTEHFLVKIYSPSGQYKRAIYHPYSKSQLDISDAVEEFGNKKVRDILRDADNPSTWPAINSMAVDDENRLWISTITDNKEQYQWWVISNDGQLLDKFIWPRSRSLEVVKDGNAYVQKTNEKTGVEQIVRYGIKMSK